jgi:hypothetical protein
MVAIDVGLQSGKRAQLLQLGVIFLSFTLCASVDIQAKLNTLSLRQRLGQMTCVRNSFREISTF